MKTEKEIRRRIFNKVKELYKLRKGRKNFIPIETKIISHVAVDEILHRSS